MTIKTAKPPAGATAKQFSNLKYLGVILIAIAILGVSIKSLFGDSPEKRARKAREAAARTELFEQRVTMPRWHKGCEESIARGNVPMATPSLEEPTLFVEPVINGYARVRLDGTNEWSSQQRDRWFHSISEVWLQPNHSLTVDAIALNPDTKLAFSSTGEATDVSGRLYDPRGKLVNDMYDRALREKEEILFSRSVGDGTRRPGQFFGIPFLILVNTANNTILAAQSFEHSSAARVRFYNTTHEPMRIAIGLHRNILKRTVSCRAPHDVVEVYGESGWTGGFWEFSVMFRQETDLSTVS